MLVSVEQMTKMYNARTVLSDINLKIEDHDRIGLGQRLFEFCYIIRVSPGRFRDRYP